MAACKWTIKEKFKISRVGKLMPHAHASHAVLSKWYQKFCKLLKIWAQICLHRVPLVSRYLKFYQSIWTDYECMYSHVDNPYQNFENLTVLTQGSQFNWISTGNLILFYLFMYSECSLTNWLTRMGVPRAQHIKETKMNEAKTLKNWTTVTLYSFHLPHRQHDCLVFV